MIEIVKKTLNVFIIIFIFLALFFLGAFFKKTNAFQMIQIRASLLTSCRSISEENKQIDCVFNKIDREIEKTGNIDGGMRVFMVARNMIEPFSNERLYTCHSALHRVGEIAYYNLYTNAKDISDINFPQETTGCNYSFFHAFIEHLIQNNPNPIFATETCESLILHLQKRMSNILEGCFHGVGHGFMRAHLDQVPQEKWDDFQTITMEPRLMCGQLPKLEYKRACWSGVFQSLLISGYSLHFSKEDVLSGCATLEPQESQWECYSRTIRHLPFKTPIELRNTIIKFVQDTELQQVIFSFGIAHKILAGLQGDNNGKDYTKILALCETVTEDFYRSCIGGIIKGVVATATPQKEYRMLLTLCSEPIIIQNKVSASCYEAVFQRLLYFYTPLRMISICKKFPIDVRDECKKTSVQ
ncbi:MAG: hypothetical protein HYT93_00015 [Parcubacteria group bacterium]|nr:hypothetical protein [Parcubacteria group bacterium]